MQYEIELKLALLPCQELINTPDCSGFSLDGTNVADLLADASRDDRYLLNTYYDSPSHSLNEAGIALRVRSCNGEFLQTVKTQGSVYNGLHKRREDTCALESMHLSIEKFSDNKLRDYLGKVLATEGLSPIFTTNFHRTTWMIPIGLDENIEMALDIGKVKCKQQEVPIREIELELKNSNNQKALYKFAAELSKKFPLAIISYSKAWLGYELTKKQQLSNNFLEQISNKPLGTEDFLKLVEED